MLAALFFGTRLSRADTADGADFRTVVEKETFALINRYRSENDLPPLAWDAAVAREARGHSKDMATGESNFGHEGFHDRVDRLKAVMGVFEGAGENVFMTSDPDQVARHAVATWLHSPHHLENIRGDFNYSGIGVWQDKNGVIYFTQIFMKIGKPSAAAATPEPQTATPFGFIVR